MNANVFSRAFFLRKEKASQNRLKCLHTGLAGDSTPTSSGRSLQEGGLHTADFFGHIAKASREAGHKAKMDGENARRLLDSNENQYKKRKVDLENKDWKDTGSKIHGCRNFRSAHLRTTGRSRSTNPAFLLPVQQSAGVLG